MSLTLVLDTVTNLCACALYRQGVCLARLCDDIGKGHGEHLIGQIERLLTQAAVDKSAIRYIGVNVGPGSFTGMRIGVAVGRGLGLALGIKAIGVSRFEAINHAVRQQVNKQGKPLPCAVILPARQDKIFGQLFSINGQALSSPYQATIEEMVISLPHPVILASPANDMIVVEWKSRGLADFEVTYITHEVELDAIAALAVAMPVSQQPPTPLYLRPPDARPAQPAIL